jgi:thiol-disulfide isomerase/thioredoxin
MFDVRRVLISFLFVVTAGSSLAADPPLQFTMIPVKPRVAAPGMALKDLDGQTVDLANLRGKVVLVNFWATWCPPCRREFPSMERLRQKLVKKPLVILAVNEGENVETIDQFTSTLDVWPQFPVLLDLEGDVMASWPVRGLPTTFVIDKHGHVAYRAIGGREFDHPEVAHLIESLMGEK